MEKQRIKMFIVLVIFVVIGVIIFFSVSEEQFDQEAFEDRARQQRFIDEMLQENQVLRKVNNNLRSLVVQLGENASQLRVVVDTCMARCPYVGALTTDQPSPAIRIPLSDIIVKQDQIIINIPDVQHGIIAASKSMDPLLDENSVVLEVTPKEPIDVHIGDIIIFDVSGQRIIHRVVDINLDEEGWYAITRGDNNPYVDPYRVRFNQILGIVVGIVY